MRDDLKGYEVSPVTALIDVAFDAVVLADGDRPRGGVATALLGGARRVVCCDGAALDFVEDGGVPHAIVGDCDSLPDEFAARWARLIHRDPDQETNDLTKAVRFCVAQGFHDLVILGATGKREDHTIGNVALLAEYVRMAGVRSVRMVTDSGIFDAIGRPTLFDSYEGQQVSILCPDPRARITTANLRYPLRDASLTAWWQGTLNEALGDRFGIGTTGDTIVYRLF